MFDTENDMSSKSCNDQWIIFHRQNPNAKLRLFCFPYAGAGASAFRVWPEYLGENIEVCAVQIPGRESRIREPAFTRLSSLVQEVAMTLPHYLDRPFAFFGHSFGAVFCFELARFLRNEYGVEPVHLFVSGCRAPQVADQGRAICDLPDPQFLKALRAYNGTPCAVLEHKELMQIFLPIFRADFLALETYHYQAAEPLGCPISAFGGMQPRLQKTTWGTGRHKRKPLSV